MHKVSDRNFTMVYFSPFHDFLSFVMHSAAGELYTGNTCLPRFLRPSRNRHVRAELIGIFSNWPGVFNGHTRLLNFIGVVHSRAHWTCLLLSLAVFIDDVLSIFYVFYRQSVDVQPWRLHLVRFYSARDTPVTSAIPPPLFRIFLTPFSGRKDFPKLQRRPIFMYRKFATPSTPNVPRHRGSFPIPNYPETRYKSALRNAVAFLRNYPAKWSHCFACLTCLN